MWAFAGRILHVFGRLLPGAQVRARLTTCPMCARASSLDGRHGEARVELIVNQRAARGRRASCGFEKFAVTLPGLDASTPRRP